MNSEAVSVQHGTDGVSLKLKESTREYGLEGDFLISTIPIPQFFEILTPAAPLAIREQVKLLRYRTLLLLYLFIRRDAVLKDQCIYFTEEPFSFRRITEFKHLDKAMAPQHKTSLCIEITCFDKDETCDKDQEEIFRIVIGQLEKGGYLKGHDVEGYHFLRIPFAYPVYELRSVGVLNSVLSHLKNYRNVISIGRQGLFFYNAMNSSIMMSNELGEKLAGSDRDGWEEIIGDTYRGRLEKYVGPP